MLQKVDKSYLHIRLNFNELKGLDPNLESLDSYYEQKCAFVDSKREADEITEDQYTVDYTNIKTEQETVKKHFSRIIAVNFGKGDPLLHTGYLKK